MNIKRIVAGVLIICAVNLFVTPMSAHAILSKKIKKEKTNKKIKSADDRLAYINIDWWKQYNDEILTDYIFRALENNQDLKIATLRVEEARQNVKLQLANELPTVVVGASPAIAKLPGYRNTSGVFSIPALVNYEADIFLKNHDKTKSARKLHDISKLREKAVYISVVSAVGATYYNIVKLDKLIAIQDEIIKDRKKIFDLMKQRHEVGITSTSDLVKAEKSYILSASEKIEYIKARDILLNSLAVLIGDNPNNVQDYKRISYDKLLLSRAIPDEISTEIITNRPDYLIAEKMVEKAGIDVRVAKKEFLPVINLSGLMVFNTSNMPGLNSMNWASTLFGAGAAALLPLYTGGRKIAYLRLKKNKYEQVLQEYYKTNLVSIKEVNDSLNTLKLDDEKYKKNLKSLDMENRDFNYTVQKYNNGIISYLDLLQIKETKLVTEKMVTSSKSDCFVNQISLYKAVAAANL